MNTSFLRNCFIAVSVTVGIAACSNSTTSTTSIESKPVEPTIVVDKHAQNAKLKESMRTVQIAVEQYAADHQGHFPPSAGDELKSYMPGGGSDGHSVPANGLVNPYTNQSGWPVLIDAHYPDQALPAGTIGYTPLNDGAAYEIVGYEDIGKLLKREGTDKPFKLQSKMAPSTTP